MCVVLMCADENPCENGATCVDGDAPPVTCQCADGFTGDTCDEQGTKHVIKNLVFKTSTNILILLSA